MSLDKPAAKAVTAVVQEPVGRARTIPRLRLVPAALFRIGNLLSCVSSALVLILMLLMAADVIGRFAFTHPVTGAYEFAEVLMVGIVFLGLASVQAHRGHIGFDLFLQRLSQGQRWWVSLFDELVAFFIAVIIFVYAFENAILAYRIGDISMGRIPFPLWPAKAVVAVGVFFLILTLAVQLIQDIADKFNSRTRAGGSPEGVGHAQRERGA